MTIKEFCTHLKNEFMKSPYTVDQLDGWLEERLRPFVFEKEKAATIHILEILGYSKNDK